MIFHQIEQVVVMTVKERSPSGDCQVQIVLIVRIATQLINPWHILNGVGRFNNVVKEVLNDLVRQGRKSLPDLRAIENVADFFEDRRAHK